MTPEQIIAEQLSSFYDRKESARGIIAALRAAGYKIMAREPLPTVEAYDPYAIGVWQDMWDATP